MRMVPFVVPQVNQKARKAHKIKVFKGDRKIYEIRNRWPSQCGKIHTF